LDEAANTAKLDAQNAVKTAESTKAKNDARDQKQLHALDRVRENGKNKLDIAGVVTVAQAARLREAIEARAELQNQSNEARAERQREESEARAERQREESVAKAERQREEIVAKAERQRQGIELKAELKRDIENARKRIADRNA
jgi:colicin import membrane protein